MCRFRIEYSKEGAIAYISHLDLSRMFERAARRAELPVALTQGYHPHYKMSFGSVLPVGIEGDQEYLDLELNLPYPVHKVQEALEKEMPEGLRIHRVKEIPLVAPALMSLINVASYAIRTRVEPAAAIHTPAEFNQRIERALSRETWPVMRIRKKGNQEIDARSGLISMDLEWRNGLVEGEIWLRISPNLAVRPIEILEALEVFGGINWLYEDTYLRRTGLFVLREGDFLSPMEVITR